MWKKHEIVKIPSKNETYTGIVDHGSGLHRYLNRVDFYNAINFVGGIPQHLYILGNGTEEIKTNDGKIMGDWVWNTKYRKLFQMNGDITEFDWKIVGTTDRTIMNRDEKSGDDYWYSPLPKISLSLVKKYCEGNVNSVSLNYEDDVTLKVNPNGTLSNKLTKVKWNREEVKSLLFKFLNKEEFETLDGFVEKHL